MSDLLQRHPTPWTVQEIRNRFLSVRWHIADAHGWRFLGPSQDRNTMEHIVKCVNDEALFGAMINTTVSDYLERGDTPELKKIAEAIARTQKEMTPCC